MFLGEESIVRTDTIDLRYLRLFYACPESSVPEFFFFIEIQGVEV